MAVIDDPLVQQRYTISRAAVVSLTPSGVQIPVLGSQPSVDLGLAGLVLLERLSAGPVSRADLISEVAQRTACEPGGLSRLVDDLSIRGLLVGSSAEPVVPPRPARDNAGTRGFRGGSPAARASSPVDRSRSYLIPTPVLLRLQGDFQMLDSEGGLIAAFDARHLAAASEFRRPVKPGKAHDLHMASAGPAALEEEDFQALVGWLLGCGLLEEFDESDPAHARSLGRVQHNLRRALQAQARMAKATRECVNLAREDENARPATATKRFRVIPINTQAHSPLALGMIIAYAKKYDGGRLSERYQFCPSWVLMEKDIMKLSEEPGIYLFSNYVWSHKENLLYSQIVKERNPSSITIHGGPDTPGYPGDAEAYFRANPHVDITVRGEGEVATAEILSALADVVGSERPDLSVLRDVAGITYRVGDEVVRTVDRERISDLDTIPSPYLTGEFDAIGDHVLSVIIETNRGCPYGCTFCDWGSATRSRIRKFSLERVFAEIEWAAQHGAQLIFVADANFGIFERDVEIAEKIAEQRRIHGHPELFIATYAKNTVKHQRKIIESLAGAGILTEGVLSLQSMDSGTLDAVRRSNIKLERYEELAVEFRKEKLPLFVDIMMGLPGSTLASFSQDLQECIDREVYAKVYPTELLVNSPMNEPSYRELHRIETDSPLKNWWSTGPQSTTKRALVVSTASYTRKDYEAMMDLRGIVILCENFGVLRQVARFVRQEAGLTEMQFYDGLRANAASDPERWPLISFTLRALPDLMAEPVSWRLFMDEVRQYLVEVLGLVDDSAMETVMRVQHALLPSRGRTFPLTLDLPHDYALWHAAMIDAKDRGMAREWQSISPRLRDLSPGRFTVEDPHRLCQMGLGFHPDFDPLCDWELHSPVARASSARYQHT